MGLLIINGLKRCCQIISLRSFLFGFRAILRESIAQRFCLKSALCKRFQMAESDAFILLLIDFSLWIEPLVVFMAESAVDKLGHAKRLPLFCLAFNCFFQIFEMVTDTFVSEEVFCMWVIKRVVSGAFLCKVLPSIKSLLPHLNAAFRFDVFVCFGLPGSDDRFHQFIMSFIACYCRLSKVNSNSVLYLNVPSANPSLLSTNKINNVKSLHQIIPVR